MLSGEPTRAIQAYSSSGLASASPSTLRELDLGTEHWGSGKGTRSHGSGSALMPSTTHFELAMLRKSVSEDLTRRHGQGHWSHGGSERGVLRDIRISRVLVARAESPIIATLSLATKKPWAIDVNYFTPVRRSVDLLAMAVAPRAQGRGV